MKRHLSNLFIVLLLLLAPLTALADQHFSAQVVAFDPPAGVELDAYDKLFLQIDYESDAQVRFKIVPFRGGVELEYGAMTSSTMLWPAGKHNALVWASFSTTTHIDQINIIVLDPSWDKIDQVAVKVDSYWNSIPVVEPREPAAWVKKMLRKNRLRQELAFDPNPQNKKIVYDTFFYVSVLAIPFYLILQFQFLRLWRGRWRELAAIPIISITPLIFMAILGLGIELRLWIIFLFRGMPLALFYLCTLWFAKWMTGRKEAE